MIAFADDPAHPGGRIWCRSHIGAVFSAIVAAICGAFALGFAVLVVGTLFADLPKIERILIAAFFAIAGSVCAALAEYVWRDARGKWGVSILLDDEGLALDLPRDRSLVHRPPAFHGRLAWSEIRAVESRLEGYSSQLMGMIQRSYWLSLDGARRIFLFEDRAIASGQETAPMTALAEEIARRGGVPLVELPMVEGKGGVLGAWFTAPPAPDAPALSAAERSHFFRLAVRTGGLAVIALVAVIIAMIAQ